MHIIFYIGEKTVIYVQKATVFTDDKEVLTLIADCNIISRKIYNFGKEKAYLNKEVFRILFFMNDRNSMPFKADYD